MEVNEFWMKCMRIGIDIRCLLSGKRTGVEEYAIELLEHLFARDRENAYVLFWSGWTLPKCPNEWDKRFPNVRLSAFRIPNKLLNVSLWYFGWPFLDRLVGGTDVFFVPNLNFAAFSRKTKVVVTAHDLSFEYCPETFSLKRRLWHLFVRFRSLIRRTDQVIAVSSSTRDDLVRLYRTPSASIRVIRSGIAERFRFFDRNDSELRRVKEKYQLPYRFVLFLGTVEPRKNISALLRAWEGVVREQDLSGVELVIAGSFGWKGGDLAREWRALSDIARKRIRRIGFVDDVDKPALYNLASVFVYPSLYEGFGFPPLEALLSGTPVIAPTNSSFPEMLGSSALLIDALRPDDLRRAILEVLRDRRLAQRLSEKGREIASRFRWDTTAKETLAVFRNVVKGM